MCSCDIWQISRLWSGLSYQFHCLSLHAQQPHTHLSIHLLSNKTVPCAILSHSQLLSTNTHKHILDLSLSVMVLTQWQATVCQSSPPFFIPSALVSYITSNPFLCTTHTHTHTHTLNHGWTCLISTPLLCITSHSLHSYCIDPACRHT